MARNTGKKSKATDFAVRPVDTVQQRAHARDKRLMIIYGVGSVLYVVLFVASFWGFYRFLFLTSFRTGFTKALSVGDSARISAADQASIAKFAAVCYLVMFLIIMVVPMIVTIINFVTRLRRWRRYVYCSSPRYLQSLVDGQADQATKETMTRIVKELSYVNRQCPNDQSWLWTPAEGLVECPYCHRMV